MSMRFNWMGITLALALTVPASAASVYENSAFNYAVDQPDGWNSTSTSDANPSIFQHKKLGIALKLKLARKPQALTQALGQRMQATDEEKLKQRFPSYRQVKVSVAFIGGDAAIHYGFAFRGDDGQIRVVHSAVLSHADGAEFVWMKLQAVYLSAQATEAEQALSVFLSGFRWKKAQPTAHVEQPEAAPQEDSPVATTTTAQAPAVVPLKPGVVDYTADYVSMQKDMSEADTAQLKANYVGDGHKRTDKERERARQFFGGGDLFNRTDK
jgi:hypothetical protein